MPRADAKAVLRDLGARVAELRVARDLTQQQLAEAAGFSVKYLQRIEGGRANLTVQSLVDLANLFDVAVSDLLAKPARGAAGRGRPKKRR